MCHRAGSVEEDRAVGALCHKAVCPVGEGRAVGALCHRAVLSSWGGQDSWGCVSQSSVVQWGRTGQLMLCATEQGHLFIFLLV